MIFDECFKNTVVYKLKDKLKYLEIIPTKDGKCMLYTGNSTALEKIFWTMPLTDKAIDCFIHDLERHNGDVWSPC